MKQYDVVVIGGGPAGMAAAIGAREKGDFKVLIIERSAYLGGILNQCIHSGFGVEFFKEELSGPSYAQLWIEQVRESDIEVLTQTTVIDVNTQKQITYVSSLYGCKQIKTNAIILAMGARERPRGALMIPGDRCSGIFTAGTAQYLMNIDGYLIGKEIAILGSGDIGLIMARRLTLEGAHVIGVFEQMDHVGGIQRNVIQCLHDYHIPLYLSHTITKMIGSARVEAIEVAQVDSFHQPYPDTRQIIPCDSVLLSVGLLPEIEVLRSFCLPIDKHTHAPMIDEHMETSIDGVFLCGNASYIHDIVDVVSKEGLIAGTWAVIPHHTDNRKRMQMDDSVTMLVPQFLCEMETTHQLYFRIHKDMEHARVIIKDHNHQIVFTKVCKNMSCTASHSIKVPEEQLSGTAFTLSVEEMSL